MRSSPPSPMMVYYHNHLHYHHQGRFEQQFAKIILKTSAMILQLATLLLGCGLRLGWIIINSKTRWLLDDWLRSFSNLRIKHWLLRVIIIPNITTTKAKCPGRINHSYVLQDHSEGLLEAQWTINGHISPCPTRSHRQYLKSNIKNSWYSRHGYQHSL